MDKPEPKHDAHIRTTWLWVRNLSFVTLEDFDLFEILEREFNVEVMEGKAYSPFEDTQEYHESFA